MIFLLPLQSSEYLRAVLLRTGLIFPTKPSRPRRYTCTSARRSLFPAVLPNVNDRTKNGNSPSWHQGVRLPAETPRCLAAAWALTTLILVPGASKMGCNQSNALFSRLKRSSHLRSSASVMRAVWWEPTVAMRCRRTATLIVLLGTSSRRATSP